MVRPRAALRSNITLLLFLGFLLSSVSGMAQKVTLKEKDAAFKTVMDKITNQTGYAFFYNAQLLKGSQKVTINVTDAELEKVLNEIFEKQPFGYSLANKTIVIVVKKKPEVPTTDINVPALQRPVNAVVVQGIVTDSSDNPLQGITITNEYGKDKKRYAVSNLYGRFDIVADKGDKLTFSGVGYNEHEEQYKGEGLIQVKLSQGFITMQNAIIEAYKKKKQDLTTNIDLTNRGYMNLSQILQGTIPGLSLQIVSTTNKKVTGIEVWQRANQGFVYYDIDQFLRADPRNQQIVEALQTNNIPGWLRGHENQYILQYVTTVNSTLVPELRGANTFNNKISEMLVVIDGFPRDEFPADYPMSNVESIQVVKDPKELVKWGARAAAGIILITTRNAKPGRPQISYSSNFYYSRAPKFDRNKMQLASSGDILDYLKQVDSTFPTVHPVEALNMSPAERLLNDLRNGMITQETFGKSWDSLGKLSNDGQLDLLQQNSFNQNHMLTVSGGGNVYRYMATGVYGTSRTSSLGNRSESYGANLNSDLNLLKNKFRVKSFLSFLRSQDNTGTSYDLKAIQPYQLLVDGQGKYIYDYTKLSPRADSIIGSHGYKNYGVNLLEDGRVNSNTTKAITAQSRLNVDWDLLPGLKWSTSWLYKQYNADNENFFDVSSSNARQFVDDYGEPTSNGVNFYVPPGNIMKATSRRSEDWNVRSALMYSRSFKKHDFDVNVGAGAASDKFYTNYKPTMYGYNKQTNTGGPVFLPTPDPAAGINNFYTFFPGTSSLMYPMNLLIPAMGDTITSRNINWNYGARYTYDSALTISGNYNSVMSPNYGQSDYAVLSFYDLDASLKVPKKITPKWISDAYISTGISGNKMPSLPAESNARRYYQNIWNNYAIWVDSYTPVINQGQRSRLVYQKLTLKFDEGKYLLGAAFNTLHRSGLVHNVGLDKLAFDSSSSIHYFSAQAGAILRNEALVFNAGYDRSPEGDKQINGSFSYDIAKETYFHSRLIDLFSINLSVETISSYQALGLMMGTNAAQSGGGFSLATNNNFSILPPRNTNIEAHLAIGIKKERYLLDLRYYNHKTEGLNNNVPLLPDPSTGLTSQISYSNITNKGIEFFLKGRLVNTPKFSYTITLNGAYNVNVANQVPIANFSASSLYTTAYRSGYSVDNLWSLKWAGLDTLGRPQIYNSKGQRIYNPDSATLASSLIYSGVTRPPWTGGFIQDVSVGSFFGRVSVVFNLGYVMRRYLPSPSSMLDNSILIRDRWRKRGDEAHTEIAAMAPAEGYGDARTFIIQNSNNSIVSADNIRLQEVMVGWEGSLSFIG